MKYSDTKEWHNWYRKKNLKKMREYKREWMRRKRRGLKTRKVIRGEFKQKPKKGHCDKCTILLASSYAVGHNGTTCGRCLCNI